MTGGVQLRVFVFLLLSSAASAQVIISKTTDVGPELAIGAAEAEETTYMLWQIGEGTFGPHSLLESPSGSVSVLDLKAPAKARREYDKGYRLLQRKNLQGAVDHLTLATSIYSSFVAAHTALGSAYLSLMQHEEARTEFAKAAALDDHLPGSFLNLACAQLALKDYSAAEESIRKASAKAPLDLHLLTALAYGEFLNQDYQAAVATAQQIHARQHTGFAKVHLYAAAALGAQHNLPEAQRELKTYLREDPKSPSAPRVIEMLRQLQEPPNPQATPVSEVKISYVESPSEARSPSNQLPGTFRKLIQASKENTEIAEAEAETACPNCEAPASSGAALTGTAPVRVAPPNYASSATKSPGFTVHASADEVAVFFAATDHGKSVTDLTGKDVSVRDNRQPPAAVTGFRNESQLPLRLAIVIDTSASIAGRFKFAQDSAVDFLHEVLTGRNDLAFVIGVANSVLLVQDFTADQDLLSHAVGQLAPSGGTALWDAVAFAVDKLGGRLEDQPVARVLVVISDGENNSSSVTLKQVIDQAQREEVFIYTVSTQEADEESDLSSSVGKHALKTLAELTGGAAFAPGSIHPLNASLVDLQELIRSRYLISYKPAQFKRDGQYRPIDLTAQKDGRKLRVFARKGYFASVTSAVPPN